MTWRESLCIGIPEIDKQHKQLCDSVDALFEACTNSKGADEVLKMLNFLENYTTKHFFEEEKLQIKIGYPKYKEHKSMHDDFINQITAAKKDILASGVTIPMVLKVNRIISSWLTNHIMKTDMDLKNYIK